MAGVEDLTPNDLMIKFTERSIEAFGPFMIRHRAGVRYLLTQS